MRREGEGIAGKAGDLKGIGLSIVEFPAQFSVGTTTPRQCRANLSGAQGVGNHGYFKQPGLEDKFCITVSADECSSGAG